MTVTAKLNQYICIKIADLLFFPYKLNNHILYMVGGKEGEESAYVYTNTHTKANIDR